MGKIIKHVYWVALLMCGLEIYNALKDINNSLDSLKPLLRGNEKYEGLS